MRSNQNKARREWKREFKIRKNVLKMRFKILKQIAKDIVSLPAEVRLQCAKVNYSLSEEETLVLSKYIKQEYNEENK